MPGPTNGPDGGVSGIQPGVHDAGIQGLKPKKAKWGIRELFSFSPEKLFAGKQSPAVKTARKAFKSLQQYKIRTFQPRVHIQNTQTSKTSLTQQTGILIDKGYTSQEAKSIVRKLNRQSGGNPFAVEESVARVPYRNKQRQQWAQWAEQSFLQKGYTPQEARKWSQGLLKEAGTNYKGVEHVIRNTPATPAMQAALNARQQTLRHQMKTADFQWAVNHFVQLGHSPKAAHKTVINAQHHYGDNRQGFIEWVQKAPPARIQAPSANDQVMQGFVEQKLKPWAMKTLEAKGFDKNDAALLIDNLLRSANGRLNDVMGTIKAMPSRNPEDSGSANIKIPPQSRAEVEASKEQDRKHLSALGLEEGSTRAQVRKTYRKLALKLHPDKNNAPDADARFMAVESAYKALEASTTFDVATLKREPSEEKDRKA